MGVKIKKYINAAKTRVAYYKNWTKVDFDQLSHLVLFLGSPRSGTTLVRTIIDAHPNALIGNEVHILRLLKQGKSWEQVVKKLCLNHEKFKANPFWTDYSYQISGINQQKKVLKIIGDKRSIGTIKAFVETPELITQFFNWSPLPIKIIRCVRHPLDVIATKHWRNKKPLDWNIEEYFFAEKNAERLASIFGQENVHRIYNEQLIEDPEQEIRKVLTFLGLEIQDDFLAACKARINPKASLSRTRANWEEGQVKKVREEAKKLTHLERYLIEI